ncbi:MAG: insulinase family protein [Gammaproteobacteria bacterium]|nr:insulinase family protein [Gammaproteobacteria bacterium]
MNNVNAAKVKSPVTRVLQGGLLLLLWLPTLTLATVFEMTMQNGMKVIVKRDTRAPVVVSQVWYKVGSSYEHDGITGVSHLLEHMMFKGTEKYPAGEFSRVIAENGGRENAFTGPDYTGYYQMLEKSRLPVSLRMEADRMRNLLLPDAEFVKERAVVVEERRLRTEDKPTALALEQFMASAFIASPYHHPIIGWMDDVSTLEREDLQTWYQRWYAPNNATLVVVGDVEAEEVFRLAQTHFGTLPASAIKPVKSRSEPQQKGERRLQVVSAEAKLPMVIMGYKAPALLHSDARWKAYALEVLAHILAGGDSARLGKDLVRGQGIAASASAGYDLYARLPTLFTLNGTPVAGRSAKELEQALREQINRLQREPVSSEELERVKVQVMAGKVYELDSIYYQAMQIGALETVGIGWKEMEHYVDAIDAVTPAQLQQVAREFLDSSQLTVAHLLPQGDAQPSVIDSQHGENSL